VGAILTGYSYGSQKVPAPPLCSIRTCFTHEHGGMEILFAVGYRLQAVFLCRPVT